MYFSTKGGVSVKAVCIKSYYDKCLHRSMTPGDELEVTEERFAELSGERLLKRKKYSLSSIHKKERLASLPYIR